MPSRPSRFNHTLSPRVDIFCPLIFRLIVGFTSLFRLQVFQNFPWWVALPFGNRSPSVSSLNRLSWHPTPFDDLTHGTRLPIHLTVLGRWNDLHVAYSYSHFLYVHVPMCVFNPRGVSPRRNEVGRSFQGTCDLLTSSPLPPPSFQSYQPSFFVLLSIINVKLFR